MSFFKHLEEELAMVPDEVRLFFVGLGHYSGALTAAAATAETLVGAPELVPLTQAAGASASALALALGHTQSLAGLVSAVSDQVAAVANVQGAHEVATVAQKISSGAAGIAAAIAVPGTVGNDAVAADSVKASPVVGVLG